MFDHPSGHPAELFIIARLHAREGQDHPLDVARVRPLSG